MLTHDTVIAHLGVAVAVKSIDGTERIVPVPRSSDVVIGDTVELVNGRAKHLPRRNYLARQITPRKIQIAAANLDAVGIVIAPQPETPLKMIDQIIVCARAQHINPFIIINKCDRVDQHQLFKSISSAYPSIPTLLTSTKTGAGIDHLSKFLATEGRTVLLGVSGVGKSTLSNVLLPKAALKTAIHDEDSHGKHTTTVATLHQLPNGGELIDAPGLREFTPTDLNAEDLKKYFAGFDTLSQDCRFRDCLHQNEPGCAITQALAADIFSQQRYKTYLELLKDAMVASHIYG